MYVVTLQAADGRTLDVRVSAESDEHACRVALRLSGLANHRGGGWRPLRVIPAAWCR